MARYFEAKLRLFSELLPRRRHGGGQHEAGRGAAHHRHRTQAPAAPDHLRQRRSRHPHPEAEADAAGPAAGARACSARITSTEFPVAGGFQAENLLAALGLVIGSGSDANKIAGLIGRMVGVPGRIEHVADTPAGGAVYVDYAHKPGALEAVLTTLRPHAARQLAVVFGCGGDRDRGKRPMMGEIATRLADRVIVTDDNPRSEVPATIRAEILAKAPGAIEVGDRAEAIRVAMSELQRGRPAGDRRQGPRDLSDRRRPDLSVRRCRSGAPDRGRAGRRAGEVGAMSEPLWTSAEIAAAIAGQASGDFAVDRRLDRFPQRGTRRPVRGAAGADFRRARLRRRRLAARRRRRADPSPPGQSARRCAGGRSRSTP